MMESNRSRTSMRRLCRRGNGCRMHFTFQDGTNVVYKPVRLGGFGAPRASRVSLTGSFGEVAQSAGYEWTIDFFFVFASAVKWPWRRRASRSGKALGDVRIGPTGSSCRHQLMGVCNSAIGSLIVSPEYSEQSIDCTPYSLPVVHIASPIWPSLSPEAIQSPRGLE